MSMGLSAQLRAGTRRAHRTVENVAFMRAFLRGTVDGRAYGRLLSFYLHLYTALEEALERHRDHPAIGPIARPELYRREAVLADLAHFAKLHPIELSASPATRAYVERIGVLADAQPHLLVAHAYTRYLGDLSGGQILRNIVARAFRLSGRDGLGFYDFEHHRKPTRLPAVRACRKITVTIGSRRVKASRKNQSDSMHTGFRGRLLGKVLLLASRTHSKLTSHGGGCELHLFCDRPLSCAQCGAAQSPELDSGQNRQSAVQTTMACGPAT